MIQVDVYFYYTNYSYHFVYKKKNANQFNIFLQNQALLKTCNRVSTNIYFLTFKFCGFYIQSLLTMIKKYGIGLAATIIAFSAAAFTGMKNTVHPYAKRWYVLKTPTSDPSLNSSYQLAPSSGADPGCASSDVIVCAVRTDPSSGNANIPDQSQLDDIATNSSDFTTVATDLEYKH